MTLPHEQMIVHITCLLNIEEEEVHHQFPTVYSLLPIDRSPPTPTSVLTPNILMLAYASTTLNDVDNYKGIISPPTLSYLESSQVLGGRTTSMPQAPVTFSLSWMEKKTSLPLLFPTTSTPPFLNSLPLTVADAPSIPVPFMLAQLGNTTLPSPLKMNSYLLAACSLLTLLIGPCARKTIQHS